MEKLKQLALNLLDVCDNSVIRGRAKYNQIGRAVDAIVSHCTVTDFDADEVKEAQVFLTEIQDAMGSQQWRLNTALTRISMFNTKTDPVTPD